MTPVLAEIFGPEGLIVLAVIALLFGASRLPHLARSLGSAKSEFEKGLREGAEGSKAEQAAPAAPAAVAPPVAPPAVAPAPAPAPAPEAAPAPVAEQPRDPAAPSA